MHISNNKQNYQKSTMEFYLTSIRIVIIKKTYSIQGSVVYAFIPAQKTEANESLRVPGHSGTHSVRLSQKMRDRESQRQMQRDGER